MKDKDHIDFRNLNINREQYLMSSEISESINELKSVFRQYLYKCFPKLFIEDKNEQNEELFWNYLDKDEQIVENKLIILIDELNHLINQIRKNSSENLISRKIKKIEEKYSANKKLIKAIVEYLLIVIDSRYIEDLGHTEAWIYLDKYYENLSDTSIANRNKIIYAPTWLKGDLNKFFTLLKNNDIIESSSSFEQFKLCFNGEILNDSIKIEFKKSVSIILRIVAMELLHEVGLINSTSQKSLGHISGIKEHSYKDNKSKTKAKRNLENRKYIEGYQELKHCVFTVSATST
ncbi:MAG: hypothetical protein P8N20_03035 [Flavobacteriaceae bacterium]|nr:hypothetical protein [Flavobacteriaceae bacterium]